jgi:hypothetical protein
MLDMMVTFRTIDSNGYENQYSLSHFQSWRTSKVFIPHPRAMTADSAAYVRHTREICNVAANIRNNVNANQGWTIAGWYQKGEIDKMERRTLKRYCDLFLLKDHR